MEIMYDRVAGLDVGKASVTVCVRTPGRRGRHSETRTFKTTTGSLQVMRDWLLECGVQIAAMESTSTYWKPPFYCLEEVMETWLLNAAHMKAVPGRKTDVRDAEWIAQLLEHGLLTPSFVPPPDIRRLRLLTRYRVQLQGDRTREMVRLELMLEDASIKLSSVASKLTTVSARAMLAAMIDGQNDPKALADLAKGRMRSKIPDLEQALDGHFDAGHALLARSILHRIDQIQTALAELDEVIDLACEPWTHQIELLQTIPGFGPKVAQVFIAETGGNMTRFHSAANLAAWAGSGAGGLRVSGPIPFGREPARGQVAVRDPGRSRRIRGQDARQELPRRTTRPHRATPRHGTGPGRGRALHDCDRLPHAHPRRALPRPRSELVPPQERGTPHPPAGRPTRTPRTHRGPRRRQLTPPRDKTPDNRPSSTTLLRRQCPLPPTR